MLRSTQDTRTCRAPRGTIELMDVLNAHERPPESLKLFYKRFQKISTLAQDDCHDFCDFGKGGQKSLMNHVGTMKIISSLESEQAESKETIDPPGILSDNEAPIYEFDALPGSSMHQSDRMVFSDNVR